MKAQKSAFFIKVCIALSAFLAIETAVQPLRSWADMNHRNGHQHRPSPSPHQNSQSHDHEMLEISEGIPVPTLDLVLHQDRKKGWNLELKTTNFAFAPTEVNQNSKLGEGHAHLYINGQKINRLYSHWYHLESLPPGKHEITVELNDNHHRVFSHQGKAIRQTISVTIPES